MAQSELCGMTAVAVRVSANGRIVIPAGIRAEVGLERGGEVIIEVVDGELRIRTAAMAMERARALVRKIMRGKKNGSVDDFLADRRGGT
jgi:antitoxin PrlF